MEIWKKFDTLECGVNDDGNLFLGDNTGGFNLPYTNENKWYILEEFERTLEKYYGYTYVSRIGDKFDTYRKIENNRGKWIAENIETGEFFPITYEQARGFEPINPSGIELLARELGRILL